MKSHKTHKKLPKSKKLNNYPESRKSPGEQGVSAEVVAQSKRARLAVKVPLQHGASAIRVSTSTLFKMEEGRLAMSQEQANILFAYYAQRGCEVAANLAAVLGS